MNLLRALSDTTFGKDKEVLLSTYKLYIRSLFDYAAPVVYPNYSDTSILRLQRIQNRALRLSLGCHSTSSVDHIHAESLELPVSDHLRLLSAQFLARCLQPSHPSFEVVTRDTGRRQMKETLRSKVIDQVHPYLDAPGTYGESIKSIHSDVVRDTISRQAPNRVLGHLAPPISAKGKVLPPKTRAIMSQLRSGFCSNLPDYQFRIGRSQEDLFHLCLLEPQTVRHLFDCPLAELN